MGDLILGEYSYSYAERRGNANTVTIGKFCSIATNVIFAGGWNHRTEFISTFPFHQKIEGLSHLPSNIKNPEDINIGHDVWIGEGAILMEGISIGTGAIIGCSAVVTKDVAPYTIVGGVPARIIRKRFLDYQIDALMKIQWWLWDIQKIKDNAHLLQSENIDAFILEHDRN